MIDLVETFGDVPASCVDIIDVRTPLEFAQDHVPGAINLPVLDDAQRAEVGTIYVQSSKFAARRIGAAYIARNIATHLETALKDRPGGYAPLIYCWRGGQRSHAMATVLSQVGWRARVLKGGYMTYRRHVTARLYGDAILDEAAAPPLILLDGDTGTAKTEMLGRLGAIGVQILDLEALASHRGSVFGGLAHPQPSQKLFESRLLQALDALDAARPIVVEAEASRIGDCTIPPTLWKAMAAAPRVELQAPATARARYLVQAYSDLSLNPARLDEALSRLPSRHGRERLETWRGMAWAGELEPLALELIERHYDPAYRGASRRHPRARIGVVSLTTLDADDQRQGAVQIAALVSATT